MCQACGCGDSNVVPVALNERILAANDRAARHNREHFRDRHVSAINLMGSPGAGKTAVLEATARALGRDAKVGVLAGDLATDNDARRIRAAGPSRRHHDWDCFATHLLRRHVRQSADECAGSAQESLGLCFALHCFCLFD